MPVAVASFVGSLAPTRGRKGCLVEIAGALSLILSSLALLLLTKTVSFAVIFLISFGFGIGFGVLNMSNQQRLLDYAPTDQSGSAAGLLRTAAYLGALLSAPLVGFTMSDATRDRAMATIALLVFPIALVPLCLVILDIARGRHVLTARAAGQQD